MSFNTFCNICFTKENIIKLCGEENEPILNILISFTSCPDIVNGITYLCINCCNKLEEYDSFRELCLTNFVRFRYLYNEHKKQLELQNAPDIEIKLKAFVDVNVERPSGTPLIENYEGAQVLRNDTTSNVNIIYKEEPGDELLKMDWNELLNKNDLSHGDNSCSAVKKNCDSAVVELLLDHGADVNTCCETQSPAVFNVVERSDTQCGVKIFISNCYAQSVIHAANASGSREIRQLLFEYIANHFSPKTNWTELADAILDEDVEKVTDLIQKGHKVDRISLYIGILSKDSRMFNLVWDNTAPEVVERDPYFLMHVFENWPEDAELEHMFNILRKEGLKLRVDTCADQFSHFVYRYYNFVSSMTEEEWIEIIEYLFRGGMRLNSTSLDLIVQTASHESMVHFIEIFIKTFQPKLTQEVYATAVLTHLDERFLLQYFLEPMPDIIYGGWDLQFWLYYMGLFTFNEFYKEEIRRVARDNVPQVEAVEAVLNQMSVKSLREIARDAIREQLDKVCFDCRQMMDILRKSKIPTPIKQIIQLQTPVNLWVYNVAAQFKGES